MSAPGYEVRGDAKDRRKEGSLSSAEGDESEELQLMTEERRSETEGPVWICRESIGANKAVVSGRALWWCLGATGKYVSVYLMGSSKY